MIKPMNDEQQTPKLELSTPIIVKEKLIKDRLLDLLIEFDEMGFEPTALPPPGMSAEEYAKLWQSELLKEIQRVQDEVEKKTVKEILQKVKSYTLDKEVGLKYLLQRLAKEYSVELEQPNPDVGI